MVIFEKEPKILVQKMIEMAKKAKQTIRDNRDTGGEKVR
jgi:hypothetical protein